MIILVIGDLHIPQRKLDIPDAFKQILTPGKIHRILCTGNLTTKETLNYLKKLCKDVILVTGEEDESGIPDSKETQTVKLGEFRFGIIHGHQVVPWGDPERLGAYARELGVDVLVSGHTQIPSVAEYEGRLLLNPGSATGAFSPLAPDSTPSFLILDVKGDQMTIYHYKVTESQGVEVSHTIYNLH
ncbi:Vacuolar protein sorting-associated protein 29 [Tritrichomonas musculus]|uniref:Vacuolar protein sorting-associated protein 29 n=1 Tax=Tritrichomonas musculus TaxID=1915356 RepID=A0ABR2K772_9EUKA